MHCWNHYYIYSPILFYYPEVIIIKFNWAYSQVVWVGLQPQLTGLDCKPEGKILVLINSVF